MLMTKRAGVVLIVTGLSLVVVNGLFLAFYPPARESVTPLILLPFGVIEIVVGLVIRVRSRY